MNKLPASAGWDWIRQGFELFRKQAGGLFMLFLGYMLMVILLGFIPLLGQFLPVALMPVFTAIFMQACVQIDQGKRISPMLLAEGFRHPKVGTLVGLGVLYILVAAIALGVSTLADDGVFLKLVTGRLQPDAKEVMESNAGGAMLLAMLLYLPAMMAFWFAAPLIAWQRMGLLKSLFYSFFAVLRAMRAFLLFLFSWFGIALLCTQLVFLIFGRSSIGISLLTPLWMVLTIIVQCSLYASYRQIFGATEEPPPV
jgi:hypothetical protein